MSIQSVSFGAVTNQGNNYKKTHVGTVVGAVAGAGATAYTVKYANDLKQQVSLVKSLIFNSLKCKKEFVQDLVELDKNLSIPNKYYNVAVGVAAVVVGLSVFGVGALVNKVINKVRANQIDKVNQIDKTNQSV